MIRFGWSSWEFCSVLREAPREPGAPSQGCTGAQRFGLLGLQGPGTLRVRWRGQVKNVRPSCDNRGVATNFLWPYGKGQIICL